MSVTNTLVVSDVLQSWVNAEAGANASSSPNYAFLTAGAYLINVQHNPGVDVASFAFRASCTQIEWSGYDDGHKVALWRNGVEVAQATKGTTNAFAVFTTLATGLDSAEADYRIVVIERGSNAATYLEQVRIDGTFGTATPAEVIQFYGDSITQGAISGILTDNSEAFPYIVANSLGLVPGGHGVSGSTVHQFPSGFDVVTTRSGEARTAEVTTIAPKYIVNQYGINDIRQVGGTESAATFGTSYLAMLNAQLAGATGVEKILCVGITPYSAETWANIQVWNAEIVAAIAACDTPAKVSYLDPEGIELAGAAYNSGGSFDSTNYVDGLHLNATGHALLASAIEAAINGSPLTSGVLSFVYATSSAIRTSWTNSTGGTAPLTYNIHRGTSPGFTPGGGNLIDSDVTSPYDDTTASAGVLYYYQVVTVDADTNTVASNEVSAGLPFVGTNEYESAVALLGPYSRLDGDGTDSINASYNTTNPGGGNSPSMSQASLLTGNPAGSSIIFASASSQYLDRPNTPIAPTTILFWVKRGTGNDANWGTVSQVRGFATLAIALDSGKVRVRPVASVGAFDFYSNATLTAGTLYLVGISIPQDTGDCEICINGVSDNTTAVGSWIYNSATGNEAVGYRRGSGDLFLDAQIQDLMYFDTALTAAQQLNLYIKGTTSTGGGASFAPLGAGLIGESVI